MGLRRRKTGWKWYSHQWGTVDYWETAIRKQNSSRLFTGCAAVSGTQTLAVELLVKFIASFSRVHRTQWNNFPPGPRCRPRAGDVQFRVQFKNLMAVLAVEAYMLRSNRTDPMAEGFPGLRPEHHTASICLLSSLRAFWSYLFPYKYTCAWFSFIRQSHPLFLLHDPLLTSNPYTTSYKALCLFTESNKRDLFVKIMQSLDFKESPLKSSNWVFGLRIWCDINDTCMRVFSFNIRAVKTTRLHLLMSCTSVS